MGQRDVHVDEAGCGRCSSSPRTCVCWRRLELGEAFYSQVCKGLQENFSSFALIKKNTGLFSLATARSLDSEYQLHVACDGTEQRDGQSFGGKSVGPFASVQLAICDLQAWKRHSACCPDGRRARRTCAL